MRYLIYVEKEITKKTLECVDVMLKSSNLVIGYFSSFGRCEDLERKGINFVVDDAKNNEIEYDVIIAGGDIESGGFKNILVKMGGWGIPKDLIVMDKTVCVRGFDFGAYKKLRDSQLTIMSNNCFGGIVYNLFGIPFRSPLINMFESATDYIKIMKNLSSYMDKELRFYKWNELNSAKKRFPSFYLGDAILYMNHYYEIDYARQKWEERRLRINPYNIIAIMYTNDEKVLMEFDKLPFSKKVCFVPFETDIDSAYYLPPDMLKGQELWRAVNDIAFGRTQYYNLWSMLLYGKKELLTFAF